MTNLYLNEKQQTKEKRRRFSIVFYPSTILRIRKIAGLVSTSRWIERVIFIALEEAESLKYSQEQDERPRKGDVFK